MVSVLGGTLKCIPLPFLTMAKCNFDLNVTFAFKRSFFDNKLLLLLTLTFSVIMVRPRTSLAASIKKTSYMKPIIEVKKYCYYDL